MYIRCRCGWVGGEPCDDYQTKLTSLVAKKAYSASCQLVLPAATQPMLTVQIERCLPSRASLQQTQPVHSIYSIGSRSDPEVASRPAFAPSLVQTLVTYHIVTLRVYLRPVADGLQKQSKSKPFQLLTHGGTTYRPSAVETAES